MTAATPKKATAEAASMSWIPRLLVVDDEEAMRVFLRRTFAKRGADVHVAVDGVEALEFVEKRPVDLVVTDLRMPRMDGMELLARLREGYPGVKVVVMTGHGTIRSAIDALKSGAENYVTKPLDRDELIKTVDDALERTRLAGENRMLRELLDERRFEGLVGTSAVMRKLYRRVEEIADRDGAVLIQGESGTGKELVARAVHARSRRRDGPFVAIHCGAVPESLIASELFGVEAGAFTGAEQSRPGRVRAADNGTVLLDEIGEVRTDVQSALLRLVEGGEITPVGSGRTEKVDVRIIAATHRNLRERLDEGLFRDDLYYRLGVFVLDVPALRERRSDIRELVDHFIAVRPEPLEIEPEALAMLESYDWPGNVRQLENAVARMVATAPGTTLGVDLVPEEVRAAPGIVVGDDEILPFKAARHRFERGYLADLMRRAAGNVSEASRLARISRPTLHAKLKAAGLEPDEFRR